MPAGRSCQAPPWDAKSLLEITTNPFAGGRFTCSGTTRVGRRCRNPLEESAADGILGRLPQLCHDSDLLERELNKLVHCVYCHLHKDQEHTVEWRQLIVREAKKSWSMQSSARSFAAQRTPPSSPNTRRTSPRLQRSSPCSDSTPRTQTTLAPPRGRSQRNGKVIDDTTYPPEDDFGPTSLSNFDLSSRLCETPCGHEFCSEYTETWLDDSKPGTCPSDRRPLQLTDVKLLSPLEDDMCPICLSTFDEACETPCGHEFCQHCIKRWLSEPQQQTCPSDSRPLRMTDVNVIPLSRSGALRRSGSSQRSPSRNTLCLDID